MYDNLALIIDIQDSWNIHSATLFHVEEHVCSFGIKGKVETVEFEADEALCKLLTLCAQCERKALYKAFGKKFKNEESFWEKADEQMQRHVKQIADKRLKTSIEIAWQLNIRLFFRETNKKELLKKNILSLSASAAVPQMTFSKGEEGIDYSLRLKLEEEQVVVPCEHNPFLLTETPGMLLLGDKIYAFPDNFSGKLLLPFLGKRSTFIPRRMQNEYFHRFILKNTYKTEIQADGFDIIEEECERKCQLLLEKNIHNEAMLCIRFMYGDVAFEAGDRKKLFVRLEEEGDSFRFVKFTRDEDWELSRKAILKEKWKMPEKGTLEELIDWLRTHCEDLKQAGITFLQPSTRRYYIGEVKVSQSATRNNDWFQLHIEIHFDNGEVVPFLKLKDAILRGQPEYMLNDGSVFLIPEEWFVRYGGIMMFGRVTGENLSLHRSQMPVAAMSGVEGEKEQTVDLVVPKGLKAKLRHYQQTGFEWLYHHLVTRTGCCLSDDMGLGKTVQTIALLMKYKETCPRGRSETALHHSKQANLFSEEEMQGVQEAVADNEGSMSYETVLVVSPASVVYNWRNELHRFAPRLTVCEYTGTTEERLQKRQALMRWDVVLTTYQTLRNDIEHLSRFFFGILVFDESQCFKNRNSQLHQSVSRLQSHHRMALSGTPLENSLSDLWSLMNVLNPALLGSHSSFQNNYINPISNNLQDRKTAILRTLVTPYFLKRSKEDVLPDLPARQDEIVYCEMTSGQQREYNEELSCARNFLLSQHEAVNKADEGTSSASSVHVLTAITRLRQIACHPQLAGKESMDSGKFNEVFSRLEELHETEHKALIFSEYVSLLHLVGEEMTRRNWTYELLTGETTNREAVINRFDNSDCHFFLISLKAGGVGLNLTSADYVFLLDPWWNNAAEEQAISRAHRIGQQRPVFVYRFISCGTLEEKILNLQDRKQSLIEAVLPFIEKE